MNCNSRIPGGALSSAFGGSKFFKRKAKPFVRKENRPAPYNCRQANQTAALAGKEAFP